MIVKTESLSHVTQGYFGPMSIVAYQVIHAFNLYFIQAKKLGTKHRWQMFLMITLVLFLLLSPETLQPTPLITE